MNDAPRAWGVYRELAHSPGRESDDAAILRETGRHLERHGFDVHLATPEEITATAEAGSAPPPFLFVMCERVAVLETLAAWERAGAVIVNGVDGIRNTYRDRTIALFDRDRVPFPKSVLVPTAESAGDAGRLGATPQWIKRADVHATEAGDVSFAPDAPALRAALARLAARGIDRAVVQEHVPGDLIKFYGVGGAESSGRWFQWFYHRDQTLAGHVFDPETLLDTAFRGASSLALDVFGGDAIVGPDGRAVVIDLNAWPSFALYRATASERIAAHVATRFRGTSRERS